MRLRERTSFNESSGVRCVQLEPESTTEGYGRLGFLKRAGAFGSNGSPIASPTMRHSFGVGCCRCGKKRTQPIAVGCYVLAAASAAVKNTCDVHLVFEEVGCLERFPKSDISVLNDCCLQTRSYERPFGHVWMRGNAVNNLFRKADL